MSSQQWGAPPSSGGGAGSVQRARERAEAGLPPEITPPPQNRPRPQMPAALAGSKNAQGAIGIAISRPTQVPQWPLAGAVGGAPNMTDNQPYQPPAGRENPPQRPPRPSRVPSILDSSRVQEHTPAFRYRPQQAEQNNLNEDSPLRPTIDDNSSSGVLSPSTPASRQSTNSSVGSIPDFPLPMPPPPPVVGPPRKTANLGPPPPVRRAASSYYSQGSLISPIPEESPRSQPSSDSRTLHGSYASSAAIPSTWDDNSPKYDDDYDDQDNNYDDARGYGTSYVNETIEEDRESRGSNTDDNDDRGLIRSASLGKRAKPAVITTVKASDRAEQPPSVNPQQKLKLEKMGVLDGAAVGAVAGADSTLAGLKDIQKKTMWPMIGRADSPLATNSINSALRSEDSVPPGARIGLAGANDAVSALENRTASPNVNARLGANSPANTPLSRGLTSDLNPAPGPGFSRLSELKRPPRLNLDAVRDAEARGSLTSLPDLIRRATVLASMIDRGKRPGSRIHDLNDFPPVADIKEKNLNEHRRHNSGLSGMLAAFPSPSIALPSRGNTARPASSWPSAYNRTPEPLTGDHKDEVSTKRRRRCCGLPVWGFLIVLLILVIAIVAAVVVPIELLVVHKQDPTHSTLSGSAQQCASDPSTACQNGGTSVFSTGTCSCICINGFTGPTCTVGGTTGCTTTTISSTPDVTLGDSIPRLISAAQTNFSIPLSSSVVLARFNSANLTCVSENALVTFNGESRPSGDAASPPATVPITTTSLFFQARFDATQQVLDFARIAVLFLLEQVGLDVASAAQVQLQHFFDNSSATNGDALNVTLGGGSSANLVGFALQLGNGSMYGSLNETTVTKRGAVLGLWDLL